MPLFCQGCGIALSPYVQICPACGRHQPPVPGGETPQTEISGSSGSPQGVGGWLMFFCISLIFFAPLSNGMIAGKALKNLATLHVPLTTVFRLASVGAIYSGLAIFSVVAGILLWLEKRRGVEVAKAYLLVAAATTIGLHLVLRLAGLKNDLVTIILSRLGYSVIWYAYLVSSTRVKLTYGLR